MNENRPLTGRPRISPEHAQCRQPAFGWKQWGGLAAASPEILASEVSAYFAVSVYRQLAELFNWAVTRLRREVESCVSGCRFFNRVRLAVSGGTPNDGIS